MDNIVTVSLRDQKISPKKVRLVIDFVRGMTATEAQGALERLPKKGAREVSRLLRSAIDAAKDKDYKTEDLYISQSICQEGRKLKRFTVKARGRSTQFKKRMSHIKIGLSKIKSIPGNESAPDEKTSEKSKVRKQDGSVHVNKKIIKDK